MTAIDGSSTSKIPELSKCSRSQGRKSVEAVTIVLQERNSERRYEQIEEKRGEERSRERLNKCFNEVEASAGGERRSVGAKISKRKDAIARVWDVIQDADKA